MTDQRFDIEPAARQYARTSRWGRLLFLLAGGALAVVDIDTLYTGPLTPVVLQLSVLGWVTAATIWWLGISSTRLPPVQLRIDSTGWAFVERSGSERLYRWDDPRLRVGFVDARGYPPVVAHPERASFKVIAKTAGVVRPRIVLTTEAFDALLTAATAHGVRVIPSDWNEPTSRQRHVIVTNRPPSSSQSIPFQDS